MVSSARPRTPSNSARPAHPQPSATLPEEDGHGRVSSPPPQTRRSLGGLLRRSKSGDMGSRRKREREALRQQQQRQPPAIPTTPPKLPGLYDGSTPPQSIPSFGGGDDKEDSADMSRWNPFSGHRKADPDMFVRRIVQLPPNFSSLREDEEDVSNVAISGSNTGAHESITNRGRMSYASSAYTQGTGVNAVRKGRKRKDPTPLNILVLGSRGAGKTSFVNFLKSSLASPDKKRSARPSELSAEHSAHFPTSVGEFTAHYIESELDGEKVGITIWDSAPLDSELIDLQLQTISSFLERKFEETLAEEFSVSRQPGVQDTHIHCTFLVMDPIRLDTNLQAAKKAEIGVAYSGLEGPPGCLDSRLDIQVMQALQNKTVVLPIVTKADTITSAHMNHLKRSAWASLKKAGINPFAALEDGDDDSEEDADSQIIPEEEEEEKAQDHGEADKLNYVPNSNLPISTITFNPPISAPIPLTIPSAGTLVSSVSGLAIKPARQASVRNANGRKNSIANANINHPAADTADEIPILPLSIITPDEYEPDTIGRRFPWGFADPYNMEHCDYIKLKETVFHELRVDLRSVAMTTFYEQWRVQRLRENPIIQQNPTIQPLQVRKTNAEDDRGLGSPSGLPVRKGPAVSGSGSQSGLRKGPADGEGPDYGRAF